MAVTEPRTAPRGSPINLLCRIVGHGANRQRARHDMEDYWAPCRRCGTMLVRATTGWRAPTMVEVEKHAANLAQIARGPEGMRME
ncbi:hypothetical protein [Sphingomonas sanxanigenens]|uniref:Uncharacterized protein n=1 Tax=Sphingomonas sanxanigenens DSM 19645 = NX02 TaxID=1123269 RepID=W0AE79_9SPHN|nr:hypothetical protein [Sphingomonas sanxanigenens]AHE54862.1 hypothetical protein NX02_15910 [Sphingomonas sanxanigenens DSM 19645 = NX02]